MEFRKLTIRDVDVRGKVVLVRVDYNVPLRDGIVVEDARIRASLPTLQYLIEQGAKKIILLSHLGRPDGEVKPELSLRPCAENLAELLGKPVEFIPEISGEAVRQALQALPEQGIAMLENLRFSPAEEANDTQLAQQIVNDTGAELFVQDGFAVIHRAHMSTAALAGLLPSVAGLLVENEVVNLEKAIENPARPLVVIIGGAKVEDKQPLIDRFLPIADKIIVGGKIAADGYQSTSAKIYVAGGFAEDGQGNKLDIDAESTVDIIKMMTEARTVVWNGVLGYVEDQRFATSSLVLAQFLGRQPKIFSIIGGGDTAGYVESLMRKDDSLHYGLVSTGGGASLELLSGKTLPGLEALQDRNVA